MTNSFAQVMKTKTVPGLMEYVNRTDAYTAEAVEAALAELQNRGQQLTETDHSRIQHWLSEQYRLIPQPEPEPAPIPFIVKEEVKEVPDTLYSTNAIMGFALFCSPFFASFLMASNLKDRKAKISVYLFGIAYQLAAAIILLTMLPQNILFNAGLNIMGGLILTEYFWKKHIGQEKPYLAKSVTKPLLIAFGMVLLVYALIMTGVLKPPTM
jgi:hypothetical protein